MGSWKDARPRLLKKTVYALDDKTLNKVVKAHEDRGWSRASENKEYNYGLGCLVVWDIQ